MDLISPIIPFQHIGFIVFAAILLIPVSYSSWILPVHNRKVAKIVLEELVPIVKDACPSIELQSTEVERLNWPDFRISQGIPEDTLLKLHTIGNAFAEFGDLEARIDCVKSPLRIGLVRESIGYVNSTFRDHTCLEFMCSVCCG